MKAVPITIGLFIKFSEQVGFTSIFVGNELNNLDEVLSHFRAGVYIQLRHDGTVYIGESEDLCRRQKQHRRNGVYLDGLAIMPFETSNSKLRLRMETELIFKAQKFGIALKNESKVRVAKLHQRIDNSNNAYFTELQCTNIDKWILSIVGPHGILAEDQSIWNRASLTERFEFYSLQQHTEWYKILYILKKFVSLTIISAKSLHGKCWGVIIDNILDSSTSLITVLCGNQEVFKISESCSAKGKKLIVSLRMAIEPLEIGWGGLNKATENIKCDTRVCHREDTSNGECFRILAKKSRKNTQSKENRDYILASAERYWAGIDINQWYEVGGTYEDMKGIFDSEQYVIAMTLFNISNMIAGDLLRLDKINNILGYEIS